MTHSVVAVGDGAIVFEGASDTIKLLLWVFVRVPCSDIVVADFELLHEAVGGAQSDQCTEGKELHGELHCAVRVRGECAVRGDSALYRSPRAGGFIGAIFGGGRSKSEAEGISPRG